MYLHIYIQEPMGGSKRPPMGSNGGRWEVMQFVVLYALWVVYACIVCMYMLCLFMGGDTSIRKQSTREGTMCGQMSLSEPANCKCIHIYIYIYI